MVNRKAMDDVQSWWEVPSIAHFCSLFRLYFDLLDFDIEEFEEALITDSVEDVGNSSLQDLIVRLLRGCFNSSKDEITTSNYQMYLRRLFRIKCEENSSQTNPFDRDVAFHSLPLRTKVEILHSLCDFRLDNDDVSESLKVLEAESLRVEPLGQDSGGSTYWYFYGTRLYREDYNVLPPSTPLKKRVKKLGDRLHGAKWQVACFTEQDWQLLTRRFKNCKSTHERSLHRVLRDDFLPELPRLFAEKEKLQRKRMMSKFRRSNRNNNGSNPSTSPSAASSGSSSPPASSSASATPRSVTEAIFSLTASRNNGQESSNSTSDGAEGEDELRRQRLEQEKADRLLAEEMQREERINRLHLRERRGGAMAFITAAFPVSSRASSSSRMSKSGSSSSDSSSNASTRQSEKDAGKSGRMTNNSLAACLPPMLEINNNDEEEEEEEAEEGRESGNEDSEEQRNSTRNSKRKEKEPGDNSRSRSRSSSPPSTPTRILSKKKAAVASADFDKKGKPRKVVTKSNEGKENEGAGPSVKKPVTKSLTNCLSGMSKTKVKSSIIFSQSEEDVQIGMHKVIEAMKNHRDAWPFVNPVDEDYAPNYYRIIDCPMDLQSIEDKLDNLEYPSVDEFTNDFQKIVDNCRKYNGPSSEYTEMVDSLLDAFNKSVQRYITPDDSDEEISIEYNNAPPERKRPRLSVIKKEEPIPEHVKENAPHGTKKSKSKTSKTKGKGERVKREKKKRKMQLMRHHSRKSETMEALTTATAETLKDINKWLDDTPKTPEYSSASSPVSLSSDSVTPSGTPVSSLTTPAVTTPSAPQKTPKGSSSSRSSSEKSHKGKGKTHRQRHREQSSESGRSLLSPKGLSRVEGKLKKKSKRRVKQGKDRVGGSDNADKSSPMSEVLVRERERLEDKAHERKEKHHHRHHHRHHHHHHDGASTSSSSGASTGPKEDLKAKEKMKSIGGLERKSGEPHRHKDAKRHSGGGGRGSSESSSLPLPKSAKGFEEKRPTAPPRPRSLLLGLKNSQMKRLKGKLGTPSQSHSDTKCKLASVYDFPGSSNSSSKSTGGSSSDCPSVGSSKSEGPPPALKDLLGEKAEKKKCLLVNDNPPGGEGGPKLSLGSVLSTNTNLSLDRRESLLEEDTDDILVLIDSKKTSKVDTSVSSSTEQGEKVTKKEEDSSNEESVRREKPTEVKPSGESAEISPPKKEEVRSEDEDVDMDRKLEPAKGFDRDKCMPNLSAWIKAFGGPKGAGSSGVNSAPQQPKLLEKHDKSKFKVMGRGVGESGSSGECVTPTKSSHHPPTHPFSPVSSRNVIAPPTPPSPKLSSSKSVAESLSWNQTHLSVNPATNPLSTPVKIDSIPQNLSTALNMSRKEDSDGDGGHIPAHRHKKHRSRKRSTSSLSSQSESGSPCFLNQDDGFSRSGRDSVVGSNGVSSVNPPRWADDHWASQQSQSPSASSQVSSQSPAGPNSPFSPPISSPPRTPQTPPRPTAPVRVGFYQDITSQNSSSPEKVNESHSNVPSPATPPTPTNHSHSHPPNNNSSSPRSRRPNSNNSNPANHSSSSSSNSSNNGNSGKGSYGNYSNQSTYMPRYSSGAPSPNIAGPPSNGSNVAASPSPNGNTSVSSPSSGGAPSPHSNNNTPVNLNVLSVPDYRSGNPAVSASSDSPSNLSTSHSIRQPIAQMKSGSPLQLHHPSAPIHPRNAAILSVSSYPNVSSYIEHGFGGGGSGASTPGPHSLSPHPEQAHSHSHPHLSTQPQGSPSRYAHNLTHAHLQTSLAHSSALSAAVSSSISVSSPSYAHTQQQPAHSRPVGGTSTVLPVTQPAPQPYPSNPYTSNPRNINVAPSVFSPLPPEVSARFLRPGSSAGDMSLGIGIPMTTSNTGSSGSSSRSRSGRSSAMSSESSAVESSRDLSREAVVNTVVSAAAAAAALEQKIGTDLNGFQWPHNLASLSQIVNSIPTPMSVGMASAYRSHFDQSVAAVENMTKFQRSEAGGYTSLSAAAAAAAAAGVTGNSSVNLVTKTTSASSSAGHSGAGTSHGHTHPHPSISSSSTTISSHAQSDKPASNPEPISTTRRQSSSKSESKRGHSQSTSKHSSQQQGIVPGSAFNFSSLTPELALYSKEMSEASGLYSGSPPSLGPALAHHHRPDIYPTSTGSFHPSFSVTTPRTTSGGVATPSLTPYQIPPFIGSHPSPYQPQSVSSQPFAHSQSPRGLPVDPYQQFFQGNPLGLLPPSGYPAPYTHPHHSLGFNRPGWI